MKREKSVRNLKEKDKCKEKTQGFSSGRNKVTTSKSDKGKPKNSCGLPGHGNHEWSACKYNPKCSNFGGEKRTPRDYKDGKFVRRNPRKNSQHRRESGNFPPVQG